MFPFLAFVIDTLDAEEFGEGADLHQERDAYEADELAAGFAAIVNRYHGPVGEFVIGLGVQRSMFDRTRVVLNADYVIDITY